MTAKIKSACAKRKQQTKPTRTVAGHLVQTFRVRRSSGKVVAEALIEDFGWCQYNGYLDAIRIGGLWTAIDWIGEVARKKVG